MPGKRSFEDSLEALPDERKRRRKVDPEYATKDAMAANTADQFEIHRQAHNFVETRVHSLETLARPYRDFEKKTRNCIQLIQQVREDVTSTHKEALEDLDQAVDAAKSEYSRQVKKVVAGCVELSTNRLVLALIKRLEDGDEIRGPNLDRLRSLIQSRDDVQQSQAISLPSPPSDMDDAAPPAADLEAPFLDAGARPTIGESHDEDHQGAEDSVEEKSRAPMTSGHTSAASRQRGQDSQEVEGDVENLSRVRRSTCKSTMLTQLDVKAQVSRLQDDKARPSRASARSSRSVTRATDKQEVEGQDDDEDDDEEKSPEPRRSRRAPKPNERHKDFDFVTWTEAKQQARERSRRHRSLR